MSLTTNLISDLVLNEASGNGVDSIGSNTLTQNGTLGQGTALILGTHSRTMAGATPSANYGQFPSGFLDAYSAWSFEIWFKPGTISNWQRVLDFGTGSSVYFTVTVKHGGTSNIALLYKIGGVEYAGGFPFNAVSGTIYQLVVTCTSSRVTAYLNGLPVAGVSGQDARGSNFAPTLNYLGKSQFPDNGFAGSVQQARLWGDRELTPQDVTALYNSGSGRAYASLAGATIPTAPTPNAFGRYQYVLANFDNSQALAMYDSPDGHIFTQFTTSYSPLVRDCSICTWNGTVWLATTVGPSGGLDFFEVGSANTLALTAFTSIAQPTTASVVNQGAGGHTWAPEWWKNRDGTTYTDVSVPRPRVVVALLDTSSGSNVLYEMHPTNDAMTTWSAPAQITGTAIPAEAIDGYMVYTVGAAKPYRLYFQNATTRNINYAESTSPTSGFDTGVSGDYFGLGVFNAEGPCAFKIGSVDYLYAEAFDRTLLYVRSSDNFASDISPVGSVAANAILRHGTIMNTPSSTDYPVTMSGGASLGGSASQVFAATKIMAGGTVLSGAASGSLAAAATGSGGVALAGTSSGAFAASVTPSGGAVLVGTASASFAASDTMAGGVTIGGTVDSPTFAASPAVGGGVILGGEATVTSLGSFSATMSGGVVLSGAITPSLSATASAAGGVALSGSALPPSFAATKTMTGGGILGGAATVSSDSNFVLSMSGGAALAGAASLTWTATYAMTGGTVAGGHANVVFVSASGASVNRIEFLGSIVQRAEFPGTITRRRVFANG